MENKKINYIVFDVNGKVRKSYISNLVATSANQKVFVFNDADITTESTAYRSYARIKRADSFNVGPITLLASEITVENTGYTQDELNKFLESINVDYTSCRILILEKQALAVSGPISITVVYDRVNELGRTIETQAKAEVSAYVYEAVEEIFTEEEYNSFKEEMLPRDLGDVTLSEEFNDDDHLVVTQNGATKKIAGKKLKEEVVKNVVEDTIMIDVIKDEIGVKFQQVEQEYAPRLLNVEQNKRDKSVKITKIDMDISANANKLGLENLQDEVIQAISGNAPVNNVIGDNAVVSEKIAEDAINIKHLNNDLKSLFFLNNKYGSDYSFVIGSFAANGLEAPATNRIRSEYISSTNPIIIELIDKIQFNMNVWLYSKEGVYIDRTGLTTEPFVLTNEYMARIVLSYADNRDVTIDDIPILSNSLVLGIQEIKLQPNSINSEKIADNAVIPEKTNFFDISPNLINIDESVIGYRLSSSTGELIEDNLYITTGFIKVDPSTIITKPIGILI